MATDEYKPGDKVPKSGIYKVMHDTIHNDVHEVTAIMGETFPPCHHCGKNPRFVLVRAASHLVKHEYFK